MNSATDSEKEITQLGLGGILKYVLRGAPFYWRSDRVPWKSVRVPRFPVVFSILSGIFWGVFSFVVISFLYGSESIDKGELLVGLMYLCCVGIIIFLVLNCLIMAGFWIVLTPFDKSLIFWSGGGQKSCLFLYLFPNDILLRNCSFILVGSIFLSHSQGENIPFGYDDFWYHPIACCFPKYSA